MRKIWTIAAAATLAIPVSLAAAHPGEDPGRGSKPEVLPGTGPKPEFPGRGSKPVVLPGRGAKPEWPGKGKKPKVCHRPGRRSVKYIVRGVLVSVSPGELVMDVTRVNHHAKLALAGSTAIGAGAYSVPMLTVKLDSCTRITTSGKRPSKRTWEALTAGDRVVVGWRAKKGAAYIDLGAAIRVVDVGPAR